MDRIKLLQQRWAQGMPEADEVTRVALRYEALAGEMDAYENSTITAWCEVLANVTDQKLKQPLLRC
jgi:hypothetical protein